ncbi:hypothetical protein GCM10027598_85100 [Amycolatopsis oliviviridis]|uniref:WXG100 family type VII secretion target n=2 Tax=Amycolatopsis TaxID=1813 RepID=A0A229S592_9PSEU|nr:MULTISPECIES: hypothetical protein [Amycolatopsis]OXM54005.1 hypothetical protein CFP71_20455 [Amycolatopsis thailandensis]RSN20606.1 hypothetical protein DMC61_37990 [Amycolatopsis sp. WAC 04169]GHH07832.1 hypothetical protein GCM10017790_14990 [Amycolatopsis oliviviridis]
MADQFRLDPEALERVNGDLAAATARFKEALRELGGKLAEHYGCWGEDEAGKAFAKNYVQTAQETNSGAHQTADGVESTCGSLRDASKQFVGLDEENARALDKSMGEQFSQNK